MESSKNILVAFFLNVFFTIIEIIGGILTNSVAIMSDAIHDLGDSISIGIALVLQKVSEKEPTEKHTYGFKRYSILGALITSVILVVGVVIIIIHAITRLKEPQEVNSLGMFIIAIFGVIFNGLAVLKTRKSRNLNERVINLHLIEDVLGWIVVLIASIIMLFVKVTIIDTVLSMLIAVYILFNVFKNLKSILDIFMEKAPENFDMQDFKGKLLALEHVKDIHHVHAWTMDGENTFTTFHVTVPVGLSSEKIIILKQQINETCASLDIKHSTIQIDYEDEDEEYTGENCKIEKGKGHLVLYNQTHNHAHAPKKQKTKKKKTAKSEVVLKNNVE